MAQMSAQNQAAFEEIQDSLAQVQTDVEKNGGKKSKTAIAKITKMHIMI